MNAASDMAVCDFCGLPLAEGVREEAVLADSNRGAPREPQYCCFGCRFAARVAGDSGPEVQTNWTLARLALGVFLSMNVMVLTMFLWSWDVYGTPSGKSAITAAPLADVFRYLCLLLTIPVLWALGVPLTENTWQSLHQRQITTDLLLLLGVLAAFVYSTLSVFRGVGHVYFEVTCMVLVMVTLGRWFEAAGRVRTTAALDELERLLPDSVPRVKPDGTRLVPLDEIVAGDVIRVAAGKRIAVDGCIRHGISAVDEHLLTGESQPMVKEPGDAVWGGSLNLDGDLLVEAKAPARSGTLQRMVDAVIAARRSKGRYERLADRVAAYFTPAVIVLAMLSFAWHAWRTGFDAGLLSALAVVLIACPCALGLATPMAVWTALGTAARRQVLFRDGDSLERLADVRGVCLDKTGTLSTAEPHVADATLDPSIAHDYAMRWLADATAISTHPLAQALRRHLQLTNIHTPVGLWSTIGGRGVVGRVQVEGRTVEICLGNERLLQERDVAIGLPLADAIERAHAAGRPLLCLAYDGQVRAVFAFDEQLRPEATEALATCRRAGLQVRVLTGDHAARADCVSRELGVEIRAELLPDDKLREIRTAQRQWGSVVMVGDGVNDAPALAAADVGMALGCGADVSRDSADVCLLRDDLRGVAWSIALARRTIRVIRLNLFWAMVYNVGGMALAATGRLNPLWAAAAMVVSSVLVITNSLRLASDQEPATIIADSTLQDRVRPTASTIHVTKDTVSGAPA